MIGLPLVWVLSQRLLDMLSLLPQLLSGDLVDLSSGAGVPITEEVINFVSVLYVAIYAFESGLTQDYVVVLLVVNRFKSWLVLDF